MNDSVNIPPEDLAKFLGYLPPTTWNLFAEVLEKAQYPARAAGDVYRAQCFLRGLISNPEFKAAFEAQTGIKAQA